MKTRTAKLGTARPTLAAVDAAIWPRPRWPSHSAIGIATAQAITIDSAVTCRCVHISGSSSAPPTCTPPATDSRSLKMNSMASEKSDAMPASNVIAHARLHGVARRSPSRTRRSSAAARTTHSTPATRMFDLKLMSVRIAWPRPPAPAMNASEARPTVVVIGDAQAREDLGQRERQLDAPQQLRSVSPMPRAASFVSSGTLSSPVMMLRKMISSVYEVSAITAVLKPKPVIGSSSVYSARLGIV